MTLRDIQSKWLQLIVCWLLASCFAVSVLVMNDWKALLCHGLELLAKEERIE